MCHRPAEANSARSWRARMGWSGDWQGEALSLQSGDWQGEALSLQSAKHLKGQRLGPLDLGKHAVRARDAVDADDAVLLAYARHAALDHAVTDVLDEQGAVLGASP